MKNKTLKNLIRLGIGVCFLAGYNAAQAMTPYTSYMDTGPSQDYNYQPQSQNQPQYQPQYQNQNQSQYQNQYQSQYQSQPQSQTSYAPQYAPRPEYTELPTWTPTQYHSASSNGTPAYVEAAPTTVKTTPTTQASTAPVKTVATNTKTTRNTVIARNTTPTYSTSNQVYRTTAQPVSNTYDPYAANGSNNLTALSVQGSGGFMPSSVWQWILVIFLILIVVIIARILGRKPSHHDVHSVSAH